MKQIILILSMLLSFAYGQTTFSGTIIYPTPFTLGATSVTTTGTQLNYINTATGTTGTNTTNLVYSTSPTLVTPILGTPTSGTLTNCTLPIGGLTGAGTGVLTAMAIATNASGGLLTGASTFSANVLTVLSDFRPTKTVTAAGTTGAQTINKTTGCVNFAAAATTLVVTNSFATTTSVILVTVQGTDVTATSARVTKASGSFTITLNAAATAETAVCFMVTN